MAVKWPVTLLHMRRFQEKKRTFGFPKGVGFGVMISTGPTIGSGQAGPLMVGLGDRGIRLHIHFMLRNIGLALDEIWHVLRCPQGLL